MPSLSDEAKFWSARAADAHHNLLETIQSSAGKWQAAIAAFLGLYATTGFVLGPDKLSSLPVQGDLETGLLAAYGAAGVCGISAVIFANLASQGIPEILTGRAITGPEMRQLASARARRARRQLGWAIKLAAIAGLLVIGVSAFLLVAGIRASNHPDATVVTKTGAYCGELLNVGGALQVRLPSGTLVPLANSSLTPVTSCPP
jgi:hypothetical protein